MNDRQGRGLLPIALKPCSERLRIVIGADGLAPRLCFDDTIGHAFDQRVQVNLQLEDSIEGKAPLLQHGIESFSLRDRAQKAVQNKPRSASGCWI